MHRLILINGYPGVGKRTVAEELCKRIPNSKVVDHRKLLLPFSEVIDPKNHAEFNHLRQTIRRQYLASIVTSLCHHNTTWICTEFIPTTSYGYSAVTEYQRAAHHAGLKFAVVNLNCEYTENWCRLNKDGRMYVPTEDDLQQWEKARMASSLLGYNELSLRPYLIEFNITNISPEEASEKIFDRIGKCTEPSIQLSPLSSCADLFSSENVPIRGYIHAYIDEDNNGNHSVTV
ncbi:hypothetical protein F5Y16DRAFT_423082 [Xylariaceae sp. FL0255]|nr:hypothetical protein F5Y16DRAFT_423082 [Xylariaceae sp. FL0255]